MALDRIVHPLSSKHSTTLQASSKSSSIEQLDWSNEFHRSLNLAIYVSNPKPQIFRPTH